MSRLKIFNKQHEVEGCSLEAFSTNFKNPLYQRYVMLDDSMFNVTFAIQLNISIPANEWALVGNMSSKLANIIKNTVEAYDNDGAYLIAVCSAIPVAISLKDDGTVNFKSSYQINSGNFLIFSNSFMLMPEAIGNV